MSAKLEKEFHTRGFKGNVKEGFSHEQLCLKVRFSRVGWVIYTGLVGLLLDSGTLDNLSECLKSVDELSEWRKAV